MKTLVYDVEVLRTPDETEGGWNNPWGMGFGTAVVYDYQDNLYRFYIQEQRTELVQSFQGNTIVSFNGIKFDNNVIVAPEMEKGNWENYDILLEVVKSKFGVNTVKEAEEEYGASEVHDGSICLDGLAKGTLGYHKTGHGAKAPLLIREGKWAEVFAYNLQDVRLTKMLYDFMRTYHYLIDRKCNILPIKPSS
jgi:hypothetical protein